VYSRAMDPLCPSPCYEYIAINKNTNLTDLSRQVSDSSAKCSEAPGVPCPNVTCPATLTNPKATCLKNRCRVVESDAAIVTDTWQIYRNEEFEFKYPSDVRVQEGIGGRISIEFNNDYLIEMYFVSASVGYPDCYITEEVKRQVVFGNYIWTSCDMGYTTVNPNGASLVFMPNSDLHQDWETQILSTFKFIE